MLPSTRMLGRTYSSITAVIAMVQLFSVLADSSYSYSFSVISLNLRTSLANDPCPSGCWGQRKERIHRMLDKYGPDLIGTQEGAPDQIAFFRNELGYASIGECAGECTYNERNSIFYHSDRWRLLNSKTYALSDTPEVVPSNTWDLQYLRAAVLGRLADSMSSQVVCMLNTHYDTSRGQYQSSVLVTKLIGKFCQKSDVVLMTGDLNALPESTAVKYLLAKGPADGNYTPLPLYDTLLAAGADGGTWIGGSFNGCITGGKIDYILTPANGQACLQSARIINDTYGGYSMSDHAAIQSNFCLGPSCGSCVL